MGHRREPTRYNQRRRRVAKLAHRETVGRQFINVERQRRDTYPNTYFGSNSTPCFFNNAINLSSSVVFSIVPLVTAGTFDALTLNDRYPLCYANPSPSHSDEYALINLRWLAPDTSLIPQNH